MSKSILLGPPQKVTSELEFCLFLHTVNNFKGNRSYG